LFLVSFLFLRHLFYTKTTIGLEDGKLHLLRDGDFILLPPGKPHTDYDESKSIIKCGMEFVLVPNSTNENNIYTILESMLHNVRVYKFSKRALQLMDQMLYLHDNPGIDDEQNLLVLGMAFLMDLFNSIFSALDETVPTREARVDKACGFIRNTVTAQTTAGEVAEYMGLSARQLSRIFERETGMTLGEYIADARQKKNRTLLMDPELTIADIAGQMHYNDASAFTRAFKRIEGVTPNQFRKAMKVFEK